MKHGSNDKARCGRALGRGTARLRSGQFDSIIGGRFNSIDDITKRLPLGLDESGVEGESFNDPTAVPGGLINPVFRDVFGGQQTEEAVSPPRIANWRSPAGNLLHRHHKKIGDILLVYAHIEMRPRAFGLTYAAAIETKARCVIRPIRPRTRRGKIWVYQSTPGIGHTCRLRRLHNAYFRR